MWRNYVICVLIGLLLVSSGSSLVLLRQVITTQGEVDRLRQQVRLATSAAAPNPTAAAATPVADPAAAAATPVADPTGSVVAPLPTVAVSGLDTALLSQIETDVASLRGLQPRAPVPLRFLDQQALQRYFLDKFNQDYLPDERESDQKLLATLGVINSRETVVQILLDVLQEQIIGIYDQDEKVMYMVTDSGQFGPDEKGTFAHEYDHALQDQHFDLTRLAPKHPDNDDRSLAIQALTEGDATLIQRLWVQKNLTADEINQLGQGSATSKLLSAPLFLREQLLFPYTDGFNFIRQIYQADGYAGIDDVFRNPPQSTAQILHPDKYRNHIAPVEVSLPDLDAGSLGPGWRKIRSNVLGELDLRLILRQLTDSTRAVRGASGWAGDRWQLLEKDGRDALVIKSVWDSDNEARTFFETFALAMKNRFAGAREEEASTARQALTASTAATEIRRSGASVVAVIAFDRSTAEAIATAVGF
jgi:hypothetical protein